MVSNLDTLRKIFDNENISYNERIINCDTTRQIICLIHKRYFLIEREYGKTSIYYLDFRNKQNEIKENLDKKYFFGILKVNHKEIRFSFKRFMDYYQTFGKFNKKMKQMKDFGLPKEVVDTIKKAYESGYNEKLKKLDEKNSSIIYKNGSWLYNNYSNIFYKMDSDNYWKLANIMNSHLFMVYSITDNVLVLYPEKNLKGKYSNYYVSFKDNLMNEVKGMYPY